MADPFVGEIRIFPFNFAPQGWAFCNGQLMPLAQNTALFSLLGTTYGGDGKSTFALPNLMGRTPMHPGQGQGLTEKFLGEEGGQQAVQLIEAEMPVHTHLFRHGSLTGLPQSEPINAFPGVAGGRRGGSAYGAPGGGGAVAMHPSAVSVPEGLPHNNMQPYLTFNFCIALQGIFPPRS